MIPQGAKQIAFDISALDPNFKAHAQRGIGRYVRELRKYFDQSAQLPISYFDSASLLDKSLFSKFLDLAPLGKQTLKQHLPYAQKLCRLKNKIIHFPGHMDVPVWGVSNYIITVLDLIPTILSELYIKDKPKLLYNFVRGLEHAAIKKAGLVIAISQNTARDVERILKIPADKIVVTPLGVEEKFFNCKWQAQASNDILYVGGIDKRKNFPSLLHTLKIILERGRTKANLVCVGNVEHDPDFKKYQELISKLNLQNHVKFTGFLSDADLIKAYSQAAVFFFPSLYEGFGLTPLEAMAAGTPLVCSNLSSMPEVVGDCGILVNPNNFQEAAIAIENILLNQELAQNLSNQARKRARLFTWEKTGQLTVEAYERVLLRPSSLVIPKQ